MKHTSRLLVLIALLALLASSVAPALGADDWYVFVYNNPARQLVRVNGLDGTAVVYDLGLPENVYIGSREMAFTADSSRVAFCAIQYAPDQGLGDAIVRVRDLASATNLLEVNLGKTMACRVSRRSFNEDASRLAVGLTNYIPGDPNADLSKPLWQLVVLDTATGSMVNEINATTPAAIEAGVHTDRALLLDIPYFASGGIVFVEIPYGTEGGPTLPSYFWHLDSGSVTPIDHWGTYALDSLNASGELVWAEQDPNLPAGDPGGPMAAFNVVKLADKSGEPRVIYHSSDWIIMDVRFINGGQQLGIQLLESFDLEKHQTQPQAVKWVALGRDGSLTDLGQYSSYAAVMGAPGGYVTFWAEPQGEDFARLTMHLDYFDGAQTRTLWTQPPDPQFGGVIWEISAVSPMAVAEGLPPFPSAAM